MSQRRLGPNGAPPPSSSSSSRLGGDTSTLHRCAIPFCSNPAIADNVCELHHSNNGRSSSSLSGLARSTDALGSGSGPGPGPARPSPYDRWDAGDRFRKVTPTNLTLAAPSRVIKKARTSADVLGHMPSLSNPTARSMARPYPPLTHERLHQMESAYDGRATPPSSSLYDDQVYASDRLQRSHTGTNSVASESEQSGDADRETSLRRERNRIAARKSRQRKLDRISNLEDEKQRLEKHRDLLVQEIRSLEKRDAGVASNAVLTVTDQEYADLQRLRIRIIEAVEDAYNRGDILATLPYFREDSIVSGPQNSSVHLRGQDAMVLDYLCTTYLFDSIAIRHVKVDSGGPRSQHFRVHWQFSGVVKSAGVSMNKDFLELIESVRGKRVSIEGVSNFSFSGDKIVYVHRTADQAKFLSALLNLSKQ